jgi:hypothetical protein
MFCNRRHNASITSVLNTCRRSCAKKVPYSFLSGLIRVNSFSFALACATMNSSSRTKRLLRFSICRRTQSRPTAIRCHRVSGRCVASGRSSRRLRPNHHQRDPQRRRNATHGVARAPGRPLGAPLVAWRATAARSRSPPCRPCNSHRRAAGRIGEIRLERQRPEGPFPLGAYVKR